MFASLQFFSAGFAAVFCGVCFSVFFEGEGESLFEGFAVRAVADLVFPGFWFPSVCYEAEAGFPGFFFGEFSEFGAVFGEEAV